jgi:hypothetical protein
VAFKPMSVEFIFLLLSLRNSSLICCFAIKSEIIETKQKEGKAKMCLQCRYVDSIESIDDISYCFFVSFRSFVSNQNSLRKRRRYDI